MNGFKFDEQTQEQINNVLGYIEPSELLYVPFYDGMWN